ncbi:MAG: hypothetical protein D6800_06790 [Candidatus Zixiibacteriota bacterium]|nr:MAG: hypothetical protein D6800_06790 [candidate division Zixibacteria bacterium]
MRIVSVYDKAPTLLETSVRIPAGSSISETAYTAGLGVVGIILPDNLDGATQISFQTSIDEGRTWFNVYDADGEVAPTAVAGTVLRLLPTQLYGVAWLRIRLGTSAAPVAASASRTFTVLLKEI